MIKTTKPFTIDDFTKLFIVIKAMDYHDNASSKDNKPLGYRPPYKVVLSTNYVQAFNYLLYKNDELGNHELDDMYNIIAGSVPYKYCEISSYSLNVYGFKKALVEFLGGEELLVGSKSKPIKTDLDVFDNIISFDLVPSIIKKIIKSYDPEIVRMVMKIVESYNRYEKPAEYQIIDALEKLNYSRIATLNKERKEDIRAEAEKPKSFVKKIKTI